MDVASKFEGKVDRSGDCHIWTREKDRAGYGRWRKNGRRGPWSAAHRLAWELVHGPIPPGLAVCHKCDNPSCVRIDHLFLGTNAENRADSISKNRQSKGTNQGGVKLTEAVVLRLRNRRTAFPGMSYKEIGELLGIGPQTAHKAATGLTWKHVRG